jgi:DNA-binding transcriptional MerR regulator
MTDSHLLAGRFGAMTRLSPKALRLYAEQGLLPPAHVDPANGYRYYAARQIPRARLIARLRRLGLPVARIASLVELSPEACAVELRAWLAAETARLADQSELVEAMTRPAGRDAAALEPVRTRDRAATKLLFRQQQVDVGRLDLFIESAEADIRAHLRDSGLPADGPMSVHFNEPVSRDNDGLVEVAVSYEGRLEPIADLRIRLQPAGREAYLPVPVACEDFPMVLRVYDAIEAWLEARGGRTCAGVPYETWPGSNGARLDVVYPF